MKDQLENEKGKISMELRTLKNGKNKCLCLERKDGRGDEGKGQEKNQDQYDENKFVDEVEAVSK